MEIVDIYIKLSEKLVKDGVLVKIGVCVMYLYF